MNNRQSGRRRGRNNNGSNNGSNRTQSGGRGGVDQANRIDSRSRGNGAQMIEKYRNLARDAQLAGDRVQTEYYLQFADHYFRVVSDFRARQEENRPQGPGGYPDRQRDVRGVEDFDGHDDSDGEIERDDNGDSRGERDEEDRGERPDRSERSERNDRNDRNDRQGRAPRSNRPDRDRARTNDRANGNAVDADNGVDSDTPVRAAPARGRRPRPEPLRDESESGGIDSAVLPPSIGRSAVPANDGDVADDTPPAPKARRPRRTLAPRSEDSTAAE